MDVFSFQELSKYPKSNVKIMFPHYDPLDPHWKKLKFALDVPIFRKIKTDDHGGFTTKCVGRKYIAAVYPQCSAHTQKGTPCNNFSKVYPFEKCGVHRSKVATAPTNVFGQPFKPKNKVKKFHRNKHKLSKNSTRYKKLRVSLCAEWEEHKSCYYYGHCRFLHRGMGVYGLPGDSVAIIKRKKEALATHLGYYVNP